VPPVAGPGHVLCASLAHAHAAHTQENRLRRDTPFLCDFQFRAPLPPPPIGAKMIPVAVDRARIASYRHFNLWWERPTEMPLELDLGISLDPLDVEQYRCPAVAPPLAPEDEALLAPLPQGPATGVGPGFRPGKARAANKAGWLMRTLYLSDMQLPKARAAAVLAAGFAGLRLVLAAGAGAGRGCRCALQHGHRRRGVADAGPAATPCVTLRRARAAACGYAAAPRGRAHPSYTAGRAVRAAFCAPANTPAPPRCA
jgi:hypothetical protein